MAILNCCAKWIVLHGHVVQLRAELTSLDGLHFGLVNLLHNILSEHEKKGRPVEPPSSTQGEKPFTGSSEPQPAVERSRPPNR